MGGNSAEERRLPLLDGLGFWVSHTAEVWKPGTGPHRQLLRKARRLLRLPSCPTVLPRLSAPGRSRGC